MRKLEKKFGFPLGVWAKAKIGPRSFTIDSVRWPIPYGFKCMQIIRLAWQ